MSLLFSNKNYLLYVSTVSLTRMAGVMSNIVLILFMIHLGGSASSVAFIIITNLLPTVLFGPFAGAFADRCKTRLIIFVSFSLKVLIFFIIPYISNYFYLYLLSFLLSLTSVISFPILKKILKNVAENRDIILEINSKAMSVRSIVEVVFPLVGASIAMYLGFHITFSLCGVIYFIALLTLVFMKVRFENDNKKRMVLHNIKEGYMYIFHKVEIRKFILFSIVIMFFSSAISILLPIHFLNHLNIKESTYGLIVSCLGIGSLIGSILVPRLIKALKNNIIVFLSVVMLIDGSLMIILGNLPNILPIILMVLLLLGITSSFYFIIVETHLQSVTPQNQIGRVFSTYNMVVNSFALLSMLIFSYIMDYTGTILVFVICGIGIMFGAIYLFSTPRKEDMAA
ncbi:MFS transporter [Virgibacillus proomii]|uniref:MFS transporter n=1 Tax=Virgibacillus proomii TaxID=84407 RepID=UPI001C1019F2|nr:MFS transporter [Virgibacillus proomii]MBU5267384.1 MFS transporter [Virgibacillus proomii]